MSGYDLDAGDAPPVPLPEAKPSRLARWRDSDLLANFLRSKVAVAALVATLLMVGLAFASPWIAPQNPYDPAQLDLINSNLPPIWYADGVAPFTLGTDDQGRDVLSAVFYGLRLSLVVGLLGVLVSGALGIQMDTNAAIGLIVLSIGLSFWVQYARTVRSSVMVEKGKDYVQAARLIGLSPPVIMVRHVLPNVTGPVFVIATINLALAIITEATLSFLGTGLPETMPSLGTLIRTGNRFLFSGEWWIVAFPGLALAGLVIAINLRGDWLRDALNPKLQ